MTRQRNTFLYRVRWTLFFLAVILELLSFCLGVVLVVTGKFDMAGLVIRALVFFACFFPATRTGFRNLLPLTVYWSFHLAMGLPMVVFVLVQSRIAGLLSFSIWLVMLGGALCAYGLHTPRDVER